jgi:hypothetical protein
MKRDAESVMRVGLVSVRKPGHVKELKLRIV